jgi:hypothetical protein
MPDLQTSMGDDILQMIVCLRDGKEAAVEQLKAMYPSPEEANNVALDIKTKLALQHQASAQPHQHPKPKPDVVVSSSDPASSGDDSH